MPDEAVAGLVGAGQVGAAGRAGAGRREAPPLVPTPPPPVPLAGPGSWQVTFEFSIFPSIFTKIRKPSKGLCFNHNIFKIAFSENLFLQKFHIQVERLDVQ